MANFKVGDEVVCIDAMPVSLRGAPPRQTGLVAGQKYTVSSVGPACPEDEMPGVQVRECQYGIVHCLWCHKVHTSSHLAWRFIKLDGLKEEHTEQMEA